MYGKIYSACVHGVDGQLIEVEIDIVNGLPQMAIVGLPDSAIRESMERVRAAIKNCGFTFPMERITVNLAPADLRKEGSSFDLAIAVGILSTSGQAAIPGLEETLVIGELALNGQLRPVPGVLSMVHRALQLGFKRVLLPKENGEEAALIAGIDVYAVSHLNEICMKETARKSIDPIINGANLVSHKINSSVDSTPFSAYPPEDYADVVGQHQAKRALMIAAAGMHNIMLIGPPGTGKTMLIRRLPSVLPPLTDSEALEVTKIYSVSGKLDGKASLIRKRPFRSPHHTISAGGLIGGGSIPKPGEISLAHKGILFLDELPEFSRTVLEVLRQPLEERSVTIGRARAVLRFPSDVMLACSMNPCPCGYFGGETEANRCTCSSSRITHYRGKISGPLLDRIDLHVEVPRANNYSSEQAGLSSSDIRDAITVAQQLQSERYRKDGIRYNNELHGKLLRKYCVLEPEANHMMKMSYEALGLSFRAHDRILKLARTIADLDTSERILTEHLAEAIQYRNLDRKFVL